MVTRRGQLKIQQMAFMLLALTLFFSLVGLLGIRYVLGGLQESSANLAEERAMSLALALANAPELRCGTSIANSPLSCVDEDKLIILQQRGSLYRNLWGVQNIEVRRVYPSFEQEILCTQGNMPRCSTYRLLQNTSLGTPYSSFVSLCSKRENIQGSYDHCDLARLTVIPQEAFSG